MANTPFTVVVPGIGQIGVVMLKNGIMIFDIATGFEGNPENGYLAGIAVKGSLLVAQNGVWRQSSGDVDATTWVPLGGDSGGVPEFFMSIWQLHCNIAPLSTNESLFDTRNSPCFGTGLTLQYNLMGGDQRIGRTSLPAPVTAEQSIVVQDFQCAVDHIPQAEAAYTVVVDVRVSNMDGAEVLLLRWQRAIDAGPGDSTLSVDFSQPPETIAVAGNDLGWDADNLVITTTAGGVFVVAMSAHFSFAV